MGRACATVVLIALKDLRQVWREPAVVFFTLCFPVAFGLLFGAIFSGAGGGGGRVDIAVVDMDGSAASLRVVALLTEDGSVRASPVEGVAAARDLVRLGKVSAALVLPKGFGSGAPAIVPRGEELELVLIADPARAAETAMLRGVLTAAVFRQTAERFQDRDELKAMLASARRAMAEGGGGGLINAPLLNLAEAWADRQADSGGGPGTGGPAVAMGPAVRVEAAQRDLPSAWELTFPQAAAWALVGCVSGFGASISAERSAGTLRRLLSLPVGPAHLIGGKSVACFVSAVVVLAGLAAVGAAVFGVRVHSVWSAAGAIVASAFAFTGLMMLLAALSRSERGSEGFVRAVLLVLALVGGAGVPLFFMPAWMRAAAGISPFRWAILALEGASFRAFTPVQMLTPLGVLAGLGVAGHAAAVFAFRKA